MWSAVAELRESVAGAHAREAERRTSPSYRRSVRLTVLSSKLRAFRVEQRRLELENSSLANTVLDPTVPAVAIEEAGAMTSAIASQNVTVTAALGVMYRQAEQLRAEQAELETLVRELTTVNQALEARFAELADAGPPALAEGELSRIDLACNEGLSAQQQLKTGIKKFLDQYYPAPERTAKDSHLPPLQSLKQLLNDLIRVEAAAREDPTRDFSEGYVKLNETHWPPYVELLVRAGVAEVHPEDSSRLRLISLT